MKFVILHKDRTGESIMTPTDRILLITQTETGSKVRLGNKTESDWWFVRETVEEIADLIKKAKEVCNE